MYIFLIFASGSGLFDRRKADGREGIWVLVAGNELGWAGLA
jgi:hypothetical protein